MKLSIYNKRRQKWFAKHGPCQHCDKKTHLEVDHIDHTKKTHRISAVWGWSEKREAERQAELAKCQVLCNQCHFNKSQVERRIDNPIRHGSNKRYHMGCRCDICIAVVIPNIKHGKLHSYTYLKCRCKLCRKANSTYSKSWTKKNCKRRVVK